MTLRAVALAALTLIAVPTFAGAQETPISEILPRLIQADIRLARPPAGSNFPSHDAHFVPGEQEKLAPYLFNQSIVSQLTTFPVSSSSGGFSYMFNPSVGTFSRRTESFGPSLTERALTIGRGKLSIGGNYRHAGYDTFEGEDLKGGNIKFYLTHEDVGGLFFEGDVIETALTLDLKTDTFELFGDYGVTDKLDIGVVLPIVSVRMNASVDATVLRLATGANSAIHQFDDGTDRRTYVDSGSATGIGDVLVRAKYRFFDTPGGGLAAGLDVRLPTGDEKNLLGAGAAQTKLSLIASTTANRFSPHVNFGYTFTGESSSEFFALSDELNYAVGTEYVANPRLTLNADLVGRTLLDSGRLDLQDRTFTFMSAAGVQGSTTKSEFTGVAGSLGLGLLAAGAKFNVHGNLLVSGSLLIPVTNGGIRDTVTPLVGVEYAF